MTGTRGDCPPRPPRHADRGIVLYDSMHGYGGAEAVTLTLLQAFPTADLCVGYRNASAFPETVLPGRRLRDLELPARFIGGRTLLGLLGFRYRTGFIAPYDWALFSGSVAVEAVHQRPAGPNLYYCHTLPRFAYDLAAYYRQQLPWTLRPILAAATAVTRFRYPRALARMDRIIANSDNVRRRLQHFLGRSAQVIHPPCDTTGFRWLGQGNYFLSSARLEPYKRVALLIDAFRRLRHHRLVVASGGSEAARLQARAAGAPNIEFVGWTSPAELRRLVGHCLATIYIPRDEDFGMSPVESMAAGKPVIGVAEGGLLETVVDGRTGRLLPAEPSIEAICEAVQALTPAVALTMRAACEARAQRFATARFVAEMRAVVAQTLADRQRPGAL